MNEPNNVNLVDWLVYADYCFDNNLNEQRARNIAKAIKYNKIYLYLCFPYNIDKFVSGIHVRDEKNRYLSDGLNYGWEIDPPEEMGPPICPFEKFKNFPKLIIKYFDKLAEIGKDL